MASPRSAMSPTEASASSSSGSSIEHSPVDGRPIFRTYVQELRYEKRLQRIARSIGLPPNQRYVPNYIVTERPAPQAASAAVRYDGVVRVTPYIPVNDPSARRRRGMVALQRARDRIAMARGEPPLLVREPTSGMLLPRDSIVTTAPPLRFVDPVTQESLEVPVPAVGFGIEPTYRTLEIERVLEASTRAHYQRSVEALEFARQRTEAPSADPENGQPPCSRLTMQALQYARGGPQEAR